MAAGLCLMGAVVYPFIAGSDFVFVFYLVCAYVVVYALSLFIGYGLLRKLNLLASPKFAAYIATAIGGNILIVFLLFQLYFAGPLLFVPAVFVLLVLLNFALSKWIFEVSNREARLIGMLVGLVSGLLSIMIGPAFFIFI